MATLEEIRLTDPDRYRELTGGREAIQRAVRGYTPTETASQIQARESQFQADRRMAEARAEHERRYDQSQAEQARNQDIQDSEAKVTAAWDTFLARKYPDDTTRAAAFQTVVDAEFADARLKGTGENRNEVEGRIKLGGRFEAHVDAGFGGGGGGSGQEGASIDEEAVTEITAAVQAGTMDEADARKELTALGVSLANQNMLITAAQGVGGTPGSNWLTDTAGNIADWVANLFDKDDPDLDVAQGLDVDMGATPTFFPELEAEEALARQQQGERAIYTDYLNRAIPEGASNIYRQYVEGRGQPLRDLFNQRRNLGLTGPVPEEGQPGGQTFAGYLSGLEPHRSTYGQRADLMGQTAGLWNRDEPFDLTTDLGMAQQRYKRELEQNPFQQYTLVRDLARIGVPQAMKAASDKQIWEDYSKWFTATGGTGSAGNVPQYISQYWNQRNP
jgi:hypothetical protein